MIVYDETNVLLLGNGLLWGPGWCGAAEMACACCGDQGAGCVPVFVLYVGGQVNTRTHCGQVHADGCDPSCHSSRP